MVLLMDFSIGRDGTIEEIKLRSALRDRRVFVNGTIDEDSMFKTCYLLDRIVALDEMNGTKEDIEIIIDSYGGYIYHGLSLISKIEALKDSGYKVVTTANSIAMSMGFMILLVGSKRRALRYSRIMCHQPSSSCWNSLQEMEEGVEETQALWQKMKELIIDNTNITEEQLDDIKARKYDWYFWADEALELGVIDAIL